MSVIRMPLFLSYSTQHSKVVVDGEKKAKIYYENERITYIYIYTCLYTPSPIDPAGASINLRPSQRLQDTVVFVSWHYCFVLKRLLRHFISA